ncbi:DNA helicase-2/ATP-dependent DNA helicase PcrA [Jatrophihabitans sp. GAS493]|uniref:UvrD-helicase domain-containing protein n=1 Tax=Jatrophihabitans sp. GAS493 TaxID=1907575 RepID=UPI000BC05EC8|nr:UvrD-helicase domain-containing protein [Jatrophihabitans sp. GAS493]SOD73179.1 DNA helicase-2/ATP-dependent DNA helicase PcrA [Jatrophihabitans sp. GAS493]
MTTQIAVSARQLAGLLGLPAPSEEQIAVIESPLEPGVVIAGAGSGKTETMSTRVVWLIANRLVSPDQVLGLTFTRKAAAELSRRIRRRLAQWRMVLEHETPEESEAIAALISGEPTVLTYAAYAGRLAGEHAMRLGSEPSPQLLSPAMRWQLADGVVRRFTGEVPVAAGVLSTVVNQVLDLADQLSDHLRSPAELEEYSRQDLACFEALPLGKGARAVEYPGDSKKFIDATVVRRALVPLLQEFARAKAARQVSDFGDQMVLAARLAELPDVSQIERDRFRVVLLDEYQDTGHAQIAMLTGLFAGGHPVTAVGDPFQSIYGWRGAAAGNIGRFADRFPLPDGSPARRYALATSWRNDAQILVAANEVSQSLRDDDPFAIELRPRPGAGMGEVLAAVTETVDEEARWVAETIAARWHAEPSGTRTAAVLVRRRSQIPLIHEALLDLGLPVEVVGLGGLLTTAEVADVRATLQVLADHNAGPALVRLLAGARWRIGPRDLAVLGRRARSLVQVRGEGASRLPGVVTADQRVLLAAELAAAAENAEQGSLVEAIDDLGNPSDYSADGYERMRAMSDELRRLRRRLAAPLTELVAEVESTIGIDVEVAARADRAGVGRTHLDRLLDEAARFSVEADEVSLPAFLTFLDAAEDEENGLEQGELSVESERIQVLTVHGAKGLEWNMVAVPGLLEGIFPGSTVGIDWTKTKGLLPAPLRGDHADLPRFNLTQATDRSDVSKGLKTYNDQVKARQRLEERRLAYVAFTRARSTLLVSGFCWDNTKKPRVVSPFLAEVAEHAEVGQWFTPEPEADNPTTREPVVHAWPVDPLERRRVEVEAGAERVREQRRRLRESGDRDSEGVAVLPGLLGDATEETARWRRDVDLLLEERARLAATTATDVVLPSMLSVSQLVALRRSPDELARVLRRPLPVRPAPLARRGTLFHTWLEQRWSAQSLLDIDELPGASDVGADDADFEALRIAFDASPWAARTPIEVEVGFEMAVGSVVVRGRMDAVFGPESATPGTDWTVVDWKTGARPHGAEAAAAAVQLAAYRLAWAQLLGIEPDDEAGLARVGAAFHYVRTNETVRPVDLLDAAGLAALING